ncbi:Uncharacterized conserved protein, DUF433 family [Rhodococcus jostii]|uniref:Uncharacterized conserved protein, DUF433 family n=2 Tax=Rhodococcus jostii TaxID=132919 RepID=A0A1H4IR19_RHOJO|nr:Uncharacterized conserved protein, DUF433 family [Rhodococcus jostii]
MTTPEYATDIRYRSGICTPKQAARIVSMPVNTVHSWTKSTKTRPAMVHTVRNQRKGWPTVPLVGIVETWSMRALRTAGVPMSKLVTVADGLRHEFSDPYVLARPLLFTDGIDLYRRERGDLFRVEDGQQPIERVIEDYLQRIDRDDDEQPTAFRLSLHGGVELTLDPRFNGGRPSLLRSRVPAFAILGALEAGELPTVVAADYGLDVAEVLAVEQAAEKLAEIA